MLQTATKPQQSKRSQTTLHDLGVSAMCLSAEHAAVFLGLPVEHARRIKQLGQDGKIPRVAVGRTYVFPVAELRKYVEENAK